MIKLKIEKWNYKCSFWSKIIIILLLSLTIGLLFETIYEWNVKGKIKRGGYQCSIEEISNDDISVKNGSYNDGSYSVNENGSIIISFPERYINKLQYRYDSLEEFTLDINVEKKDFFGKYSVENIQDYSKANLKQSVINIGGVVKSITINFDKANTIFALEINNTADKNGYRILYVTMFCSLILILVLFKNNIGKNVENGFICFCLGIGILIIGLQSTQFLAWDEHIHFSNAYDFFDDSNIEWMQNELYQYTNPESFGTQPFVSKEEKQMQMHYLNHSEYNSGHMSEKSQFTITKMGYLHSAITMKVARLVGVPFYYVILIGKLTNLLLYAIGIFFAIKIIPIYKRLVAVIGLMPTPMVLATSFSYDVVVNVFLLLGVVLLVREFYYPQNKIKMTSLIFMMFCFAYGSFPKAIYIPLVLGIVFLPKSKFDSKKQKNVCSIAAICVCLGLLMTFLIPTAGGTMAADSRGGDTNVSMQLQLILQHPFAYLKILWKTFLEEFNNYFFGIENFAHMAYMGIYKYYSLVILVVFGVFFTEKRESLSAVARKSLNKYKVVLIPLILGISVCVWSSMYLAFSEVGSTAIAGVQARYFLPLTIPVFIIFYTDKIKTNWKNENYNMFVYGIILLMWHMTLYKDYLLQFCN